MSDEQTVKDEGPVKVEVPKSVEIVSDRIDHLYREVEKHYVTKNELAEFKVTLIKWMISIAVAIVVIGSAIFSLPWGSWIG